MTESTTQATQGAHRQTHSPERLGATWAQSHSDPPGHSLARCHAACPCCTDPWSPKCCSSGRAQLFFSSHSHLEFELLPPCSSTAKAPTHTQRTRKTTPTRHPRNTGCAVCTLWHKGNDRTPQVTRGHGATTLHHPPPPDNPHPHTDIRGLHTPAGRGRRTPSGMNTRSRHNEPSSRTSRPASPLRCIVPRNTTVVVGGRQAAHRHRWRRQVYSQVQCKKVKGGKCVLRFYNKWM